MNRRIWFSIILFVVVFCCVLFVLRRGNEQDVRLDNADKVVSAPEGMNQKDKPVVTADDMGTTELNVSAERNKVGEELLQLEARYPKIRIVPVPNTPPTLSVVMGVGSGENYFARINEVNSLGDNLSDEDVQTLFALLNRKAGEDPMGPEKLDAIKNDTVNALRRQKSIPADLANNLMAMYYDKGHNNVWRDYCIQHLGGIYAEVSEKDAIAGVLWDGALDAESGIAGTSLIALANNADGTYIKKEDVAAKAFALCADPNCGELAKITALQICASLNAQQVLPIARNIAQAADSIPLRMSAIAAVGTLGNESDRDMLEKFAAGRDVRLSRPAQSALGRLRK